MGTNIREVTPMKLIHLSDLHIGKRVHEVSMIEDQEYILTKILHIIDDEKPDVVLQLSYINTTYYFNTYGGGPWWNYYPGYWNWGGWGWYYPYSFTYSYSTGSIIGELVNTNAPTPQNDKLTVIWNSYICGLLNGNNLSLTRTLDAIEQAFIQSPYLSKKQ